MGLLDTVKGWFGGGKAKVQGTVATHSDTIKGGIDKAGTVVDDKTGGKYTDEVGAAQEKGKDLVDGVAGSKPAGGDTAGPETSGPETSGPETNGTAEPPA
jgi:MT0933-like antitoxin protein